MKMDQMKTSSFRKKDLVAPIIIVILLSLAVGLIIFYVTNPIFNEEPTGPFVQELELTDNNVRILYSYVSNEIDEVRNDVFLTNDAITKDNMPKKDKLYFALQFASPEDFVSTGKRDKNNNQIFNISNEKIDTYMKRFFGSNISYSKEKKFEYTLNLSEEVKYIASLTYNQDNNGYDTILIKEEQETEEDDKNNKNNKDDKKESKEDDKVYVKPFYTKLVKANMYEDQTMELQEKVVYTEVEEKNNLYTIKVFADFRHQNLIETRNNLTKSQMQNSVFNLNEYMDKAATATYTFKTEDNKYYFYSSSVTNNK